MTDNIAVDKVRCYFCGREGVYGLDIVDTDYLDSLGHDDVRPGCRDVVGCQNRMDKCEAVHV